MKGRTERVKTPSATTVGFGHVHRGAVVMTVIVMVDGVDQMTKKEKHRAVGDLLRGALALHESES